MQQRYKKGDRIIITDKTVNRCGHKGTLVSPRQLSKPAWNIKFDGGHEMYFCEFRFKLLKGGSITMKELIKLVIGCAIAKWWVLDSELAQRFVKKIREQISKFVD